MGAHRYEVLVKGRFGPELSAALEGFEITTAAGGFTLVTGDVPDQQRLLGLLAAFDDLHIQVISVNPSEVPANGSPLSGDVAPSTDD
ncbi:hypothetical protein [Microbacterium rhizomatis]|uniref:Uncharacterized protein n=1 Tax=Microbacterium rhizomatis TaxID=1631477 RepID=A0A5J5J1I7_9MICO|nr:hypothetical protein [Microbacterium rhizomatis]KAA9108396.1 hypothetical protein F6B43_13525 [Microbacterium rhizomatis]